MVNEKVKEELAKDKGFYFDKEGNLHLTKLDYHLPENKDNHAFPTKDKK